MKTNLIFCVIEKMKAICLRLTICLMSIVSLTLNFSVVNASNDIVSFMSTTYNTALDYSGGNSFNGYCGACVGRQLQALNINSTFVGTNGNDTYDKYSSMNVTSGGYTINSFPASSYSLSQILNYVNTLNTSAKYTFIVLGFEKGSASSDGQAYGHTLLIYSVCGGTVYYTESWGTAIRTQSIDDFCSSYKSYYTNGVTTFQYEGAIWFSGRDSISPTESPEKPVFTHSVGEYGSVTFSWKDTLRTDYYDLRVYFSDGTLYNKYLSIKDTSYNITLPSGNYYAVLSAVNTTYSTYTNSDKLELEVENYKPQAPTVSVKDCNEGEETLITWNRVLNAKTYYIYIRDKNTDKEFYSGNIGNKTQFSMTLPVGEYYAYVSSNNAIGTSSTYASWKVKSLPDKPIIECKLGEYGEVEFYWQSVSLADQYDLRIYNTDDTVYMVKYGVKENKYKINLPQGTYYAKLSAVNLSNENWTNSDKLNFVISNYKPLAPIVYVENNYLGEKTTITWNKVVNATEYFVFIREKNTKKDFYNDYVGNKTEFTITLPEGNYYTYISAYNSEGYNATYAEFDVIKDVRKPQIKNVRVLDMDATGYTVVCTVMDDTAVRKVQFPTWTACNFQDDLLEDWETNSLSSGLINGNQVTYRVNISEHNNESGFYETHIYAYDEVGNFSTETIAVFVNFEGYDIKQSIEYNGKKYLLFDEPISWGSARAYCEKIGGHLVTITDSEEANIVKKLIKSGMCESYWVGGQKRNELWEWITEEEFLYKDWYDGQPDNSGKWIEIRKEYNAWNDRVAYPNTNDFGFICEFEPLKTNSTITSSDVCEFDVGITGYKEKSELALVLVLYNNDRLVGLKTLKVGNENNISEEVSYSLKPNKAKVMAWDTTTGIMPLCEAEVIPSSEFILE